jgi:hypothetical protein
MAFYQTKIVKMIVGFLQEIWNFLVKWYVKFSKSLVFPFLKLAFLLAFTLLILTVYSYSEKPFRVFKNDIKQSGIKEILDPSVLPTGKAFLALNTGKPAVMDTTKQHFLIIGDSMIEGLRLRLNDYCKQNGHTMDAVIWYSSSTKWFGSCDTLRSFIKQLKPSYVLVVIGGNEMYINDLAQHNIYIKNIIGQIGDCKYIWIGPPNWKEDNGINHLIDKNVGDSRYFPSKNLTFQRKKDGAHPTTESAKMWMDSIAVFIMNKSEYPVLMNFPADSVCGKLPRTILLSPKPPPGL